MTTTTTTITFGEHDGLRKCGECSLCCKLLPMHHGAKLDGRDLPDSFHKPAGEPCPHQRHGKGCNIYAQRPSACRFWSCRWLVNDDTAGLRRPDRSRYVIDMMPDFIVMQHDDGTEEPINIEVVQVWCDPKERDAWRDPALLAYLDRRGKEGKAALIRFSECDAITVFPPSMSTDGQWHQAKSQSMGEHTAEQKFEGIAKAQKVIIG